MGGSFHSQFDIGTLTAEQREAFRVVLRLAAEKGGRVWIAEGGEVVAEIVLTEQIAEDAIMEPRGE